MKGKEDVAPLPAAVISVLDRYAGIFRGHRSRSAKVDTGFASERALNLRVARFPGGRPAATRPESARARLSRAPSAARFARGPLTAAPPLAAVAARPQDGRRAIKDGLRVDGQ